MKTLKFNINHNSITLKIILITVFSDYTLKLVNAFHTNFSPDDFIETY